MKGDDKIFSLSKKDIILVMKKTRAKIPPKYAIKSFTNKIDPENYRHYISLS